MEYKVSFVLSPAKGGLGRLLSVKGRLTEGMLTIDPEAKAVHLRGQDALVSGIDRRLSFGEIREIEATGLENFMMKLTDGEEIQFKNVDELSSLLDELGEYCQDSTHKLVRKRIDKYEDRVRRWGGE